MLASHGRAETTHAARYITQLSKHWSHRFQVRFDGAQAEIPLPMGPCRMVARPEGLDIVLEAADPDQLARLEQVLEEHLKRFAFRERFEVVWSREAAA